MLSREKQLLVGDFINHENAKSIKAELKKMTFHHDAGHGWYEIPLELVKASGAKISNYSYKKGDTAYLEEDCDIMRFMQAIGHTPASCKAEVECIEVHDGDNSPIRDYARFN